MHKNILDMKQKWVAVVCMWEWNGEKKTKFLLKKLTVFYEPFYESKRNWRQMRLVRETKKMHLEHTRPTVSRHRVAEAPIGTSPSWCFTFISCGHRWAASWKCQPVPKVQMHPSTHNYNPEGSFTSAKLCLISFPRDAHASRVARLFLIYFWTPES